MSKLTSYFIGDSCICWAINGGICANTSQHILAVFAKLKNLDIKGLRDITPAYTSIAIHFDPIAINMTLLSEEVEATFDTVLSTDIAISKGETVTLPVVYNGPDIQKLENLHELSKRDNRPTY
jgi:inhibitor of KinA